MYLSILAIACNHAPISYVMCLSGFLFYFIDHLIPFANSNSSSNLKPFLLYYFHTIINKFMPIDFLSYCFNLFCWRLRILIRAWIRMFIRSRYVLFLTETPCDYYLDNKFINSIFNFVILRVKKIEFFIIKMLFFFS